ncbi:unnamed protein product [Lymnaea stagnalis]|uniref:Uncharacterized protein n=1 Tax=Lymnaea stagnalis TaxID=6523 RepID=A0AAV2I156_LYMST
MSQGWRVRRKSYAMGQTPPLLYSIPDTDKPVDFIQEQYLKKNAMRRVSMPAGPMVGPIF